jgi:hypothetical protein
VGLCALLDFFAFYCKLINRTTNSNKTAIAPTYTTKKIIERNSTPNNNKRPAALQKTKIKNITE